MGMPVVVAANGRGIPVTVSGNGFGVPCTLATNGYGVPVVQAAAGSAGMAVTGITFGPAAPAAPTLALTSPNTDTTPDFTLAGDLVVGDTVRFQYSTSSDFAGASELTNTIDAAEDTANAITFTTGALALGTWYFRARIERPDASASGDWSNTVTDTIIVAPTATTWNPSDKTAGLTLSNVNRTISHPTGGNTNEAIRSVAPVAAGQKVYVEYTIGAKTTAFTFGFCTIGTALAGPSSGYTTPSTSFAFSTNGNLRCQDAPDDTIAHIASFTVGDRIGIAFNATTLRAWARKNGGAWNDIKGGAQDPAAGTGGALVPSMGTLYAFCGLDANNGDAVTANFATGNWVDAAPSGFTQLA